MREREEEEEKRISRLLLSTMEGYSDSVIPPLTELSRESTRIAIDENGSSSRKRGRPKAAEMDSIHKERLRREKMAEKFSVLQSMVPNLLPKATREKIVAETIQYIHGLEKEREKLESLKKSQSPETVAAGPTLSHCVNRNSAVNVTVYGGGVVFFGIQLVSRRHLATEIFRVFEKHEAEVLAATVSVNGGHQQRQLAVTVTAVVGGGGDNAGKIKTDILNL